MTVQTAFPFGNNEVGDDRRRVVERLARAERVKFGARAPRSPALGRGRAAFAKVCAETRCSRNDCASAVDNDWTGCEVKVSTDSSLLGGGTTSLLPDPDRRRLPHRAGINTFPMRHRGFLLAHFSSVGSCSTETVAIVLPKTRSNRYDDNSLKTEQPPPCETAIS